MGGPPLEWAKDVAKGMLGSLGASDRFEVIAFDVKPRSLTRGLVDANETSIGAAVRELERLRASGGTEMVEAVIEALQPLRPDSQHQVVLITDGQIGFEDEVVRRVREGLPDGARLHTVAVGSAPNRTLTARAARAGRGVEMFVCGDGDVAGAVRRAVTATARPVLTDLRIESESVKGITPARPRDVMAGQPVMMAAELSPEGGVIEVTGRLAGSASPWTWRVEVPPFAAHEGAVTGIPLGALYGRDLIADLEVRGSGSNGLVEQVALRHRIASRMTSLVAIADEPAIDPRQPRRRVVLPVEVPAFQSAEGLGLHHATLGARMRRMAPGEVDAAVFEGDALDTLTLGSRVDPEEQRLSEQLIAKSGAPRPGFFRRLLFRPAQGVLRGRIVRLDGELIVIEYETPSDAFFAPSANVVVIREGVVIGEADLDMALSSPGGSHGKGLLLRLALRREGGWTHGEELILSWGGDVEMAITVSEPS